MHPGRGDCQRHSKEARSSVQERTPSLPGEEGGKISQTLPTAWGVYTLALATTWAT